MALIICTREPVDLDHYRQFGNVEVTDCEGHENDKYPELGKHVSVRYAIGRVINEREANSYNDSDFFATVLRDDGSFQQIMWRTTRGWTYHNGCVVDASQDILDCWNREQTRKAIAWNKCAEMIELEHTTRRQARCHRGRSPASRRRSQYPGRYRGQCFLVWCGLLQPQYLRREIPRRNRNR